MKILLTRDTRTNGHFASEDTHWAMALSSRPHKPVTQSMSVADAAA
jgi:hypothetical protein